MSTKTPAFVLGGTGYVAGELVRLIAGHPHLELKALMSDSQPGEPVARAFPHLESSVQGLEFASRDVIAEAISATPASSTAPSVVNTLRRDA